MDAAQIMLLFQVMRSGFTGHAYRRRRQYGETAERRSAPYNAPEPAQVLPPTPKQRNAAIVSQMESLGLTPADYTDAELAAMGYTHDQGLN